jgi:hypothetical protein
MWHRPLVPVPSLTTSPVAATTDTQNLYFYELPHNSPSDTHFEWSGKAITAIFPTSSRRTFRFSSRGVSMVPYRRRSLPINAQNPRRTVGSFAAWTDILIEPRRVPCG